MISSELKGKTLQEKKEKHLHSVAVCSVQKSGIAFLISFLLIRNSLKFSPDSTLYREGSWVLVRFLQWYNVAWRWMGWRGVYQPSEKQCEESVLLQQGLKPNTSKHAGNLQVNPEAVQDLAGLRLDVCRAPACWNVFWVSGYDRMSGQGRLRQFQL